MAARKLVTKKRNAADSKVIVHPVEGARIADFEQLFSRKGSPHYCWCTPYRFREAKDWDNEEKRAAMLDLAHTTPIGVLAYVDGEPVGWCSVAPRETYVKLEKSRTMPRVSEAPTWTVLCFFVVREHRGGGIARALLDGAVDYAKAHGAREIEGYPFDTAGISSTHRGHSRVFQACGFAQVGTRWVRD